MDVKEAIQKRRAYRSLAPVPITDELIADLASCAQLSASCFNNQPWQYVFVYDPDVLKEMHEALSKGNEWAKKASMIIVVLGNQEDDCVIYDRIYYRFDIGMATAIMILRATELGLVAHPIAGYSPKKTRAILDIPNTLDVIALVIVGKHAETIDSLLSDKQRNAEQERPPRKKRDEFVYINRYTSKKN
ncbi:MAG: nitroreductase family protein [Candidatus Thermoplasmatota archaeon]|nr:nitroreductase family protein [Candidatus Thermoplasmatota archaeon]